MAKTKSENRTVVEKEPDVSWRYERAKSPYYAGINRAEEPYFPSKRSGLQELLAACGLEADRHR